MALPGSIPERCTECFYLEVAIRPGYGVVALLPTDRDQLAGMFGQKRTFKELLARMEEEAGGDAEKLLQKQEEHRAMLLTRADHIREEQGFDSSPLDAGDFLREVVWRYARKFKRTRGNPPKLYVGAGNWLTNLYEGAAFITGNASIRRRFHTVGRDPAVFIRPGKPVLYRWVNGERDWVTEADLYIESNLPPLPASAFSRGRKATMQLSEYVGSTHEAPLCTQFFLWFDPDAFTFEELQTYMEHAGKIGIYGRRGVNGEGQWTFRQGPMLIPEEGKRKLLEKERFKEIKEEGGRREVGKEFVFRPTPAPSPQTAEAEEDDDADFFDPNLLIGY